MDKRVFLIVLDSVGIGEEPDAQDYGDKGANTIKSVATTDFLNIPNMKKIGFFNIDGLEWANQKEASPIGTVARMQEASKGKDTTIGHWEISGVRSDKPLPLFPNGFPQEFIDELEKRTGKKALCNKPYSGTEVLKDYGKECVEEGCLIVYTSADSVCQIAAHEGVVPVAELYECCEIARELLQGDLGVGRVIARPFIGEYPNFVRTPNRHDVSLPPPKTTMLDVLNANGKDVLGVGKIYDIFAGRGITDYVKTKSNEDGINRLLEYMKRDFNGLCFVNLVDFDMLWGHRRDPDSYAKGLTYFDSRIPEIMSNLRENDILMITADHGCDPRATWSTDHTREYVPWVIYGKNIKEGANLGTLHTFADIGATIIDYLDSPGKLDGTSRLKDILK